MAFRHPVLEILFLLTVAILWAMIFYQVFFTFLGYKYRSRSQKERNDADNLQDENLPPVSILIPSHNEELVIEKTLISMLELDYPKDKIEIIVINDGSTDKTAEIVEKIASREKYIKLFNVPKEEAAKGKSHALNLGIKQSHNEFVAIYDADNTPEPKALRYLIFSLLKTPDLAAAFGKFRTRNKDINLLTNFINLETLAFQWMIQSGRYLFSKIAILPGTNFVIRKSIIEKVGGWDENALTEDTELSIRIYEKGYEIKFVPYSVTWEEEPEKWRTWLKQRTRWVRGNFYVLKKYLIPSFKFGKISLTLELIYLFLLYYLFLVSILLSHLFFILSASGIISVLSPGPYFTVWICAFLLFIAEVLLTASYEGETKLKNVIIAIIMYFTYCQGWIILVFRAAYQDYILKGKVKWEKTKRFASK